MDYEKEAMERQNMLNEIKNLKTMLKDMESDFAESARTGKSPCFFCVNDDTCDGRSCDFVWLPHLGVSE